MADRLEREIPYLFPGDLALELDAQNFVTAISSHPIGGGGGTIEKSDLMWKPEVGDDGYVHWSLASSATQPEDAYISGAQGPAGPQGVSGNPGKTPEFQINSTNAHWEWKYSGDEQWKDLNVVASGAVGPKGDPCLSAWKPTVNEGILSWEMTESTTDPGTYPIPSGISLSAASAENSQARKTTVQIWEKGASTFDTSFDLPWGQDGAPGFSPIVTVTNIPANPDDPNHKNGGTEITITDATATNKFSAWNGNDGTMAGAPSIEGNKGISATLDGSTYKVGLSAGFYSAVTSVSSKLDESDFTTYTATTAPGAFQSKGDYASATDIADMATKTWVGQQNYLTSVPSEYITESELSSELADYIKSISIETGLSGDGVTTALGIDTTAAINFTNATAKSATSAGSATSAYSAYSASYATTAASAYINSNTTSAMSDIVNELHSKTSVTINTTNNEIKDGTSAVSAMSYIGNSQHAGWEPQKSCICQESEIYAMSQLANGQGMLFFVVSAH